MAELISDIIPYVLDIKDKKIEVLKVKRSKCYHLERNWTSKRRWKKMTDDLYYRKLESTSTSDLVDILRERDRRITQLEKENTKLKSECRTCVYTDTPCVRSDYSSKNGVCDHCKNVFEENSKLKLKLEALGEQIPWKEIKDKSEVIGKLSKAKELLKTLLLIVDNKVSQLEFQLCIADTKQFLYDEVEEWQ